MKTQDLIEVVKRGQSAQEAVNRILEGADRPSGKLEPNPVSLTGFMHNYKIQTLNNLRAEIGRKLGKDVLNGGWIQGHGYDAILQSDKFDDDDRWWRVWVQLEKLNRQQYPILVEVLEGGNTLDSITIRVWDVWDPEKGIFPDVINFLKRHFGG